MTHFYETCAICGPAAIACDEIPRLLMELDREIGMLAAGSVSCFRVIPSPGFNMYAALTAINLKRILPELELEVLCGNFNNKLKSEDIEVRDFIISHADNVRELRVGSGAAARELSHELMRDCSYLLSRGETPVGFGSHVRERARVLGQQLILTDRSSVLTCT